ncbi:MAG: hypothetical protein ABIY55_00880 [Kofleriaceae bacterium]
MRWAIGAGGIGVGVGALGVLAAGWFVLHGRGEPIPDELRLPSPLVIEQRTRTLADHLATSLGMPTWFGAPDRAPVPIVGQVIGGRGAMTVRLALDIPAPIVWVGREVQADPSGHFDFGPMRAGPYLLIAYGGGWTSRLTSLDTARDDRERAELFAYPCAHVRHVVEVRSHTPRRAPVPGVSIELAGRVIGVTDAAGAYDVCLSPEDEPRIDVKGYTSVPPETMVSVARHEVRASSPVAVGTVLRAPGVPARRVGVQPLWWHTPVVAHYPSSCVGVSVVVTSDDDGRFAYDESDLLCGFRVLDRSAVLEWVPPWPRWSHADDPLVIPLADTAAVHRPLPWTRGRARVHGAPVADARVGVEDCWNRDESACTRTTARTHRDGSFWLQVPRRPPMRQRRWIILEAAADGSAHDPLTAFVSSRSNDGVVIEAGPVPRGSGDPALGDREQGAAGEQDP